MSEWLKTSLEVLTWHWAAIPGEPKRIGILTSMLIASKIIKQCKNKRHHLRVMASVQVHESNGKNNLESHSETHSH